MSNNNICLKVCPLNQHNWTNWGHVWITKENNLNKKPIGKCEKIENTIKKNKKKPLKSLAESHNRWWFIEVNSTSITCVTCEITDIAFGLRSHCILPGICATESRGKKCIKFCVKRRKASFSLASFDGSDKNHDEVNSITPCVVYMCVYAACNVAS